jgi:hypothetical protein
VLSTNLEAENERLVAELERNRVVSTNLEAENERLVRKLRAATILNDSLKEEVQKSGQSSYVDKTTKVLQTKFLNA